MAHTLDSFPDTGNLENLKDNYQKITSVLKQDIRLHFGNMTFLQESVISQMNISIF